MKKGIIPEYALENAPARAKILLGRLEHKEKGVVTNEYSKMYDKSRYSFMLDANFEVSNKCCAVMKKEPLKRHGKLTGKVPITAQMASESKLRTQQWLKAGCNAFDYLHPISNPMSFWTEQDVLLYIKERKLPICSVYGDVVVDSDECDGQMCVADFASEVGMFDFDNPPLKTTGCNRTGCMFCGYGCHLEKPGEGRFERMKVTHPKVYDYVMRPWEEEIEIINPNTNERHKVIQKGLNYKEIIDWINEHGDMDIRY